MLRPRRRQSGVNGGPTVEAMVFSSWLVCLPEGRTCSFQGGQRVRGGHAPSLQGLIREVRAHLSPSSVAGMQTGGQIQLPQNMGSSMFIRVTGCSTENWAVGGALLRDRKAA